MLLEPTYRRLWASGFCVNVVRWMDDRHARVAGAAADGLAVQMVAVAAFARTAPLMVVGPFAGVLADRVARGRVLVVAQAGGALATALALAAIFGSGEGGYGALVALEVVFGLTWALDFPARRAALYTVLGASRVAQAMSLETVSMPGLPGGRPGRPALPGVAAAYAVMAWPLLSGSLLLPACTAGSAARGRRLAGAAACARACTRRGTSPPCARSSS